MRTGKPSIPLKVKDMDQFRKKLAAVGAQCHVLKNRIVRKVAELNGLEKRERHDIIRNHSLVMTILSLGFRQVENIVS